ncbi:chitinase 2-like 6 [Homarus americanus]|uniref:Chitinase 2-like 5 n=1 Tax=Homarus americanus TaxID=6706 RepID=A0A8J5JPE5_HOMAM|nr:chitinase 2-like 5 [Homarus americanus]KAG7161520.1 chitinase 2-like 6 [Homarus americanus]
MCRRYSWVSCACGSTPGINVGADLQEHQWSPTSTVDSYDNNRRHEVVGSSITVALASRPVFWSQMSSSASTRRSSRLSIELLKEHNFDGLDMDWEYHTARRQARDKVNFISLLSDSQRRLHANNMILTAAVSADGGMPSTKIVLGVPLYGRCWKLDSNTEEHGYYALLGIQDLQDPTPELPDF